MKVVLRPGDTVVIQSGDELIVVSSFYDLTDEQFDWPEEQLKRFCYKPENICTDIRLDNTKNHWVRHDNPQFPPGSGFHKLTSKVKREE